MKKAIVALLCVILLAFWWIKSLEPALSPDQQKIRSLYGQPQQFVITYLPRGSDNKPQLVRQEIWVYDQAKQKISFTAGKLIYSQNYQPDSLSKPTRFLPEQFYFDQSQIEVVEIVGQDKVQELSFFDEDKQTRTFVTDEVLFVMEQDYLTYLQTFSPGEPAVEPVTEPENATVENSQWPIYMDSDLNFQIAYPPDWQLNYGVLLGKGLKCDFFAYSAQSLGINEKKLLQNQPVPIFQGKGQDLTGEDGPGLGDAELFLFEPGNRAEIALLCYQYNPDSIEILKKMFSSLEFF